MLFDKKKTSDVFGVSNKILPDSYVDRGLLDELIQRLLTRPNHIALRGESKCGKSWLRQKNLPDAISIQCRHNKSANDIYVDALSQLGIKLTIESDAFRKLVGRVEASAEGGFRLLAKVAGKTEAEYERSSGEKFAAVGHNVDDLRYVADIIRESGRRLVIEDFHYMSVSERRAFAFDLKALWDYGVFVVIIGVWSQSNMLLHLNADLTGRLEEISIYWTEEDLKRIIEKGSEVLDLQFSARVVKRLVSDCFGNAGILQKLVLGTLDNLGVVEAADSKLAIDDMLAVENAEMSYADQLNPLYQEFARRVSKGIRKRKDSTGIYAHAMAVILDASDELLMRGVAADAIFDAAQNREKRIQKGNLKQVLEKFEELQTDEDGRGLVLSYNEATTEVTIVDRQVLLYRKYATVKWPWEELIVEANSNES